MGIKEIPSQFRIDSEEDLRAMVISYFSELGFDADEISCEDHFSIRLGHNAIDIEKTVVGGRSDILIARNGQPLAIVETKAPSHELTDEDAQQAISYARLLATIAPFAIVTNGRETKVYDVLANGLLRIENSQDSVWHKNGQHILALSEDLLYEAAKILIAINADTVNKFCKQQVTNALSDLKSDVKRNKKFIPDVYVERRSLNAAFVEWLKGDLPIFAIIAPSGYGKTNFMCAEVEEVSRTDFALFYSAGRFTRGLVDSVRNDFIWEFQRETETARIISRLDTLAKNSGKKLFIFLDAVDENPLGITLIKNELLDIAAKIRQYPNVRLILSCKSFDWPNIIIDGNQSFNLLAETISPIVASPDKRTSTPQANKVGNHLDEFTNDELTEAINKYKSAYSLAGEFYGELREESHNPLMLRFIAEIYGEGKEKLPTTISSLELFDLYFQRKLEPIENRSMGEIILSMVSSLIFASETRSTLKDEIISHIVWNEGYEKSLQTLLRLGVLNKIVLDEQERIGFEFNKFLLYIFAFRVKKIHALSPQDQVTLFRTLLKTKIGVEAIGFYLIAVKQEIAEKLFITLVNQDFLLLAELIKNLDEIEKYKRSPIPFEHISHYLEFYNSLKFSLFNKLSYAIMPYTDTSLGVIFIRGIPEMFRACTPAYPQSIVSVEDEKLIKQVFSGQISHQVRQDLMPVGAYHIGGIHEFAEYPQKAAFDHLTREVSSALSSRLLDESNTRDILQERIYSILLDNPSVWLQGDDLPHERYWKILGYNNIEDLGNTKISELIKQIEGLLSKFNSRLKNRDALYPSYFHRSNDLFAALFALSQMKGDENLGQLRYSVDNLWRFIQGGFDNLIEEIGRLIPIIVHNYKLLFSTNFPSLTGYSHFYKNIENLAIVEIVRPHFSDFPTLSYIVAPSIENFSPTKIVTNFHNNSLTEKLYFKSLNREGYSQGGDSGCGYFKLDINIDNTQLNDPKAWAIKTRFPSRTPVLDQVYSLISQELKYMFNAEFSDWKHDTSSNLSNEQYLRLAANSIISQRKNSKS